MRWSINSSHHYYYYLKICYVILLLFKHQHQTFVSSLTPSSATSKIRALSLDITGTLLSTKEPVVESYYNAAIWSQLPNPPSQSDLKKGFKIAFKERLLESPCFGGVEGISGRDWWRTTVSRVLYHAQPDVKYTDDDFERYFRRVYQHFGTKGI